MTTQIGLSGSQVTVRDPDVPHGPTYITVGGAQRAVDGTRIQHDVVQKRRWEVVWTQLTSAQESTLMTELVRTSDLAWSPPEGGSYTVQVVQGSLSSQKTETERYTVKVTLEEV